MAAKENLIKSADVITTAREIDFASRFDRNWEHLRDIMGIMRPIRKQPGSVLKSKYAEGELESGVVAEGDEIPYSKFTVKEKSYAEMTIKKYSKAVSLESIKDHGYDNAVQMTDDEFLYMLTEKVTEKFYAYLNTGTLKKTVDSFQMALSMAKGYVVNKFKSMHRSATNVVGFANVLDVYEYLGAANITVQNQFGFQYLKDFMGYSTLFLLSDGEIDRGTVIATPSENINMYYIDPADSDFARAGLVYTTAGSETNLIGFHTQGNYSHAVSESFAIMGVELFAEYLDAIAIMTVHSGDGLSGLTVTSSAGSTVGTTAITVSPSKGSGNSYKYKLAYQPVPVASGDSVADWITWDGSAEVTAKSGKTITVVECNSTGSAVKVGSATVVSKS